MTPDEKIARGNQAQSVLGNPVYQEAYMLIRGQMMAAFQQTTFDQTAERDEIWRKMQLVDWLEKQLKSVMNNGKIESQTKEMNQSQE